MSTTPTHPPRDTRPSEPGSVSPESPSPSASSSAFPLHNPTAPDQIGAWLDRLLRLARLPAREATELRDELDAHLRERVRDLMLAGDDEPDAIHKSISELGDLALLAHRYREASRTPTRRLIMHTAIVAAAAAALGLGAAAFQPAETQPEPAPMSANTAAGLYRLGLIPEQVRPDGQGSYKLGVFPDPTLLQSLAVLGYSTESVTNDGSGTYRLRLFPTAEPAPGMLPDDGTAAVLGSIPLLKHYFAYTDALASPSAPIPADVDGEPLSAVLAMLAESQDLRPYIHWRDLEALPDAELTDLPLAGQQLDRAFDMINDALELDAGVAIEYRTQDGLFEVASREYFDRRERELVTYDVSDLVYADGPLQSTEESEVLVQLITEIVEPDVWPQNGGVIGSISCVGGKLFVNAPPRVHARVTWLLAQLTDEEQHAADRERVLLDFIASSFATVDRAPAPARSVDEVLSAAAASPAVAADPALELTVRAALDAAQPDTEVISLAHTDAAEITPVIDKAVRPLGGSARLYANNNAVIVRGDTRTREVARALAEALDREAPNREAPGRETQLRSDAARTAEYVVRPGDSWQSIAQANLGDGDRWHELAAENPQALPGELAVGQRLRIPAGPDTPLKDSAIDRAPRDTIVAEQ